MPKTKAKIPESFLQIVNDDVIYYIAKDTLAFLKSRTQSEFDTFKEAIEKHIQKVANKSMVSDEQAASRYKNNQWKQGIETLLKIAVAIQYIQRLKGK